MGLSRPSGPVYGGKALLWAVGPATASTGATTHAAFTNAASLVVPPYEDWFVTEFATSFSTGSSVGNAIMLKSKGGSTTILPAPWGTGAGSTTTQTIASVNSGASTTFSTFATATPTPGEYEGAWVPAGSTLYVVTSGVAALAQFAFQVRGYIRFRNSTRSEG
jgi:hypothetical protein